MIACPPCIGFFAPLLYLIFLLSSSCFVLFSLFFLLLSSSLHDSFLWFCRYIRDVLLLELPIIALTAEIGIDARSAVLNAGANSLISKPAQAEDIIRVLDELIYLEI